jgi:hypothetical protein
MQKPFNEQTLWKGTLQLANYPAPSKKADMILPDINRITGKVMDQDGNHEAMNRSYDEYSRLYWQGVQKRRELYRSVKKTLR